jgi:hypothetical protein
MGAREFMHLRSGIALAEPANDRETRVEENADGSQSLIPQLAW